MLLNGNIVGIENLDELCSLTFVVDEFLEFFLHPSRFSIIHSRSAKIIYDVGYIFSFLAYKTLRAIVTLFSSLFFQLSFCGGTFIPSQLHLFIKGLIFVMLCGSFFIS